MCDMTHAYAQSVAGPIHMYVTWLIHRCDMTHPYVRFSTTGAIWPIHMYMGMTHSYMWHDSSKCAFQSIWCDMTYSYVHGRIHSQVWHDSSKCAFPYNMTRFLCVTWLIHICDMTHSPVWHDSFLKGDITHSHMWHDSSKCAFQSIWCDMTYSYVHGRIHSQVWHDSSKCAFPHNMTRFLCVTWLIHICDMTHSPVWHDSFLKGDMTHSHMWHDSFICVSQPAYFRDTTRSWTCLVDRREQLLTTNEVELLTIDAVNQRNSTTQYDLFIRVCGGFVKFRV